VFYNIQLVTNIFIHKANYVYTISTTFKSVLAIEKGKINWQFSIVEHVIAQFLSTGELVRNPNGKAIINALYSIYCDLRE